jgi:hypothetical protein
MHSQNLELGTRCRNLTQSRKGLRERLRRSYYTRCRSGLCARCVDVFTHLDGDFPVAEKGGSQGVSQFDCPLLMLRLATSAMTSGCKD